MIQVIGKRLATLRQLRRLTQSRLAALAGISPEEVYLVEKNRKPRVSAVVIGRLAAALGTTADYLLGLTADPTRPPRLDGRVEPVRLAGLLLFLEQLARLSPGRKRRIVEALLAFLGPTGAGEEKESGGESENGGEEKRPEEARSG